MSSRTKILFVAVVLALAAVLPSSAPAATLPASTAYDISTTRMHDGRVFWFQRNRVSQIVRYKFRKRTVSYRDSVPGNGEIFMRQFGSRTVQRIYRPEKSTRITAFESRDGKLFVGLRKDVDDVTTTTIAQLAESNGKWTATPLIERTTAAANGHCGEGVELIDLRPDGQPLIELSRTEGLNGACTLMRRSYELRIGTDISTAPTLAHRRTGWADDARHLDLADVAGDGKDWYLLQNNDEWFREIGGVININDGRRIAFTRGVSRVEFLANGGMLVNQGNLDNWLAKPRFSLRQDPSRPNDGTPLRRKGSIAWFHSCGDSLIEISRRKSTKRSKGGSKWNLYLRDDSGNVTRRLAQRLPRQTSFSGCDANAAVFHVPSRSSDRVKQMVVALSAGGATGSTGATG